MFAYECVCVCVCMCVCLHTKPGSLFYCALMFEDATVVNPVTGLKESSICLLSTHGVTFEPRNTNTITSCAPFTSPPSTPQLSLQNPDVNLYPLLCVSASVISILCWLTD